VASVVAAVAKRKTPVRFHYGAIQLVYYVEKKLA